MWIGVHDVAHIECWRGTLDFGIDMVWLVGRGRVVPSIRSILHVLAQCCAQSVQNHPIVYKSCDVTSKPQIVYRILSLQKYIGLIQGDGLFNKSIHSFCYVWRAPGVPRQVFEIDTLFKHRLDNVPSTSIACWVSFRNVSSFFFNWSFSSYSLLLNN